LAEHILGYCSKGRRFDSHRGQTFFFKLARCRYTLRVTSQTSNEWCVISSISNLRWCFRLAWLPNPKVPRTRMSKTPTLIWNITPSVRQRHGPCLTRISNLFYISSNHRSKGEQLHIEILYNISYSIAFALFLTESDQPIIWDFQIRILLTKIAVSCETMFLPARACPCLDANDDVSKNEELPMQFFHMHIVDSLRYFVQRQ
jgi:hypothetical protein